MGIEMTITWECSYEFSHASDAIGGAGDDADQ